MRSVLDAIGPQVAGDDKFRARMRFHQGWWRACVLGLEPGPRKGSKTDLVCSMAPEASRDGRGANFLTEAAAAAVQAALLGRTSGVAAGLVDSVRLHRNLLSSQPLAFNFFGHMAVPDANGELALANRVLPALLGLGEVTIARIHFEYAGEKERPIQDNTAFDVAVEYRRGDSRGLVGIECKYTEPFSAEAYRKPAYEALFKASEAFDPADYGTLTSSRFNQLLRTHLLAQALLLQGEYAEVHTCLFCSEQDDTCSEIGRDFQQRVRELPASRFLIRTFSDFIAHAQRQDLSWEDREWTMQLWARYCATGLSAQLGAAAI